MLKTALYVTVAPILAFGLLSTSSIAQVSSAGQIVYQSGGVGTTSREELAADVKQFNLKVVTATEKSGDYLAGVKVKVIDTRGVAVLETTMEGPWLFAQLPPGQYRVEAVHSGKTLTKTVAIPQSGRREAYFYWLSE